MSTFSAIATIKQSWGIFKKDWRQIYRIMVVGFAIWFVSQLVTRVMEGSGLDFLVALIVMIVWVLVQMAGLRFFTELARGKKLNLKDLPDAFQPYSKAVTFVIGQILVGLIVFFGFILLIIPGIYFALKYSMVQFILVDKGGEIGARAALKESARITKGHLLQILVLLLAVIGINLLGVITLGLGMIVTVPLTYVIMGVMYKHLSK